MDSEKLKWFEEIGMRELPRPFKYYLSLDEKSLVREMHYSEEYLEETPLAELKRKYEWLRNREPEQEDGTNG